LQAEIERLFEEKPSVYTDEDFLLFERFKAALKRRPRARRRALPRNPHRLACEYLG